MRVIEAVTCVHADDAVALRATLDDDGWHVVAFDATGATDRDSLMAAINAMVTFPEGAVARTWDALSDLLWNLLFDLDHDHFAVVWSGAQDLLRADLQVFLGAVRAFGDVTRSLASGGSFPRPADLALVIVGADPSFPRWD